MKRFSLSSVDGWLVRRVLALVGDPPIRLQFGNRAASPMDGSCVATLEFRTRAALVRLLLDPETGFGDGFSSGEIAVEGDLVAALEGTYRAMCDRPDAGLLARPISWALDSVHRHTRPHACRNARHHYDRGENFFRPWLDRNMVYTCAYYAVPYLTLEQAQIAKMDHICRKLQLAGGERVVEAGCGWGALALYMARHYGVSVRAFNVSPEQIRFARWRAHEEGLEHRVEFIEEDYRNIGGNCDAFVSVGMLEHVGPEHYGEFGRLIQRCVGTRGRGLLHFIGRSHRAPVSTWIRERIFPGAYVPTVSESARIVEPGDYAIYDIENLRPHYERTLSEWLARFEESWEQLSEFEEQSTLRAWRLYLAGSLVAFRVGTLQLFQMAFAGRDYVHFPFTRDHLYTQPGEAGLEAKRSAEPWIPAMS